MINYIRKNRLVAVVTGLLLTHSTTGFGQFEIKQQAQAARLSTDLFQLLQEQTDRKQTTQTKGRLREAAAGTERTQASSPIRVRNGQVLIEAIANQPDGQTLLTELQAIGLRQGHYYRRIVCGYLPIEKLSLLRTVPSLHHVRPAYAGKTNAGKVTTQGDSMMRADIARQTFKVTGAGSKIGILSDSYDAQGKAAAGVASGDLPPNVQVLRDIMPSDSVSSDSDEGQAMAELIHDVAPGAALAFHTALVSYVDYALGIKRLAEAGCNIIVDDVNYEEEPFFQDGIISQAVHEVVSTRNVAYFSAAGNRERSSYSSGFRNSGRLPAGLTSYPVGAVAHEFAPGRINQRITLKRHALFRYIFQWTDPFYSESLQAGGVSGARTDIDVLVYQNGKLLDKASSLNNNIDADPYETGIFYNDSDSTTVIELVLVKVSGPDPAQIKWINWGYTEPEVTVEFDTRSSTLVGHANSADAIAVGASPWVWYLPGPPPTPTIEFFSSAGGTPIYFTPYGQPIPAETRLKPDIVGPDRGETIIFSYFRGTSAAAPHVAGVAALLQEQAHHTLSLADIRLRLQLTAIDMDDPLTPGFDQGYDVLTGFGFVRADRALMYGHQRLIVQPPLYDCATGKISLLTNGGDGTPITFIAPGITRTPPTSTTAMSATVDSVEFLYDPFTVYSLYTPTSTTGIVEAELRRDPKPILLTALQSGQSASYSFDFAAYCQNRARIASTEPDTGLQVSLLGNPIQSDWVDVEVRGSGSQPLRLELSSPSGVPISRQMLEPSRSDGRHRLRLGHEPGLYLLNVSTADQHKTIKIVRQ